jgi:hypothetical protein
MTEFQEARTTMNDALQTDEGLWITYVSNVAMLLHDRYGITYPVTRNNAAADVLHLIFGE